MALPRHDFEFDLVVAGGGAAGFFGALACAEVRPRARIAILEKSREVLGKVRISGGGRCNVTHACFDPRELVRSYPRGSRQLIGPFHRWGPAETMAWFEERGVPLKIEDDHRVFPRSDDSASIVDCLVREAAKAGIETRTGAAVEGVQPLEGGGFEVAIRGGGPPLRARHLLLTLGGTRNVSGAEIAAFLGHDLEPAAPSLFTFNVSDPLIAGLQGLSVENARVTVEGLDLSASGPLLITHWGLSGPAILRLSAWGARELRERGYRFEIRVNWTGDFGEDAILGRFAECRSTSPRRAAANDPQFGVPQRLWRRFFESAGAAESLRWPHLTRELARQIAGRLGDCRLAVTGKSTNKDEFVTSGGVALSGVDFRTLESRATPGLFFAGEILDIDGLTGGFNFQAAWTTGRLAGEAIGARLADGA
ncbi:MAG: aminoacetone oxidase family FAD-binding enzyme [Verrucomicrobiae bacterium]|nr:aminoacetone oxidase family FAD-binding enzyme [Verrucomicrobiae bacterium]MCP5541931.1 aminoacetone oxidase family FAD-binding enzyme [Akkermansiaceae bacterium]MCP5550178.1 aminoacetone oxidase family FAD-binding enzyme [Akkermansiaceae bacterium]